MTKTLSILILAVMGIGVFGLQPTLKLLQLHAREVMEDSLKQNLPNEQLTVFNDLNRNPAISWEKENQEFHYKGDMYDVMRIEKRNGITIYYCLSDTKETEICALMDEMFSREGNSLLHNSKVLKLFIQVFTPCERYHYAAPVISYYYPYLHNYYSCHYSGCFIQITAPPPKVV